MFSLLAKNGTYFPWESGYFFQYCDRTASWDGLSRSATQLAVRPQGALFVGLIPEGSIFISLFKTKEILYLALATVRTA